MSDPEIKTAPQTRILLVDDNDAIRTVLRRLLSRSGFDVVEARNGVEALSAHKARPADIVVTDLIMPEKEGLETILELRRMQPRLRIIAMSGGGRVRAQDYLKLAAALGASRTLAKPFSEAELLKAIQELLADP